MNSFRKDLTGVVNPVPILFGMQTISGIVIPNYLGDNSDAEQKNVMFFAFPDLSVRIYGVFRLAIRLIDLSRYRFFHVHLRYDQKVLSQGSKMNTKPCIPQYLKFILQKYSLACFVRT